MDVALLNITTPIRLGVLIIDGKEHPILPVKVKDASRIAEIQRQIKVASDNKDPDDALKSSTDILTLCVPTLTAEVLSALEIEALNACVSVVTKALDRRAKEVAEGMRADPSSAPF